MLYFVATPIGNLKEITYRAVEILGEADCIYAENPRHSLKLLSHYNIKKPVFEYQKFSERQKTQEIIQKLKDGKIIAVISDAGVPLISDPGHALVDALIAHKLPFSAAGIPCAAVSALVLSGLDASAFCMAGFLPHKKADKNKHIQKFKELQASLIFYIAVHDVQKDLDFLFQHLGARRAALVREISKKFESVTRFTLGETPDFTQAGELTLVVEGFKLKVAAVTPESIRQKIAALVEAGTDKKDAVKMIAAEYGLPKSEVYKESFD
ncbi:MAG: 16S rRNA (cytidine(1402)-2'-O)-methyltransferase [Firmicutes bacterium]|nr:16S rRNA (cytidine(1402)-2'-O)-methyltransferase [Bacillota bacterium]